MLWYNRKSWIYKRGACKRVPHIYDLGYQNSMHILLARTTNFFNLIKCKYMLLNMKGILLGFKTSGNYYLACGFPTTPKHMISKILKYFYNQGPYKAHFVSKNDFFLCKRSNLKQTLPLSIIVTWGRLCPSPTLRMLRSTIFSIIIMRSNRHWNC